MHLKFQIGHFFALCTLIVGAVATIGSCTTDAIYKSHQSVPIDGWDAADPRIFNIDTLRESGNYSLLLHVRTTTMESYDFRTLYLEVRSQWSDQSLRCDTVACHLSDERGEIKGDGVARYQYTFPVTKLSLSTNQTGRITVRHIMRREILEGISDIGVEIIK